MKKLIVFVSFVSLVLIPYTSHAGCMTFAYPRTGLSCELISGNSGIYHVKVKNNWQNNYSELLAKLTYYCIKYERLTNVEMKKQGRKLQFEPELSCKSMANTYCEEFEFCENGSM